MDREYDLICLRAEAELKELGLLNDVPPGRNLSGISRISMLDRFAQIERTGATHPRLTDLMVAVRMSKQRDGRDKIYGILSLLEPSLASLILPNYGLPLLDIFFRFCKSSYLLRRESKHPSSK
jgi:hypothetical protein